MKLFANDSLYQRFYCCVTLGINRLYLVQKKMFGTAPEPEQVQKVDICKEISEYDVQIIRGLGKGEAIQIPKS